MSATQVTVNKLKGLGFTIDPKITKNVLEIILPIGVRASAKLSEKEIKKLESILLLKATDVAVLNRRKNVTTQDLQALQRFCFPGLICWKSLFLKNKKVTALVLTANDSEIMEQIGIETADKLLTVPSREVANKIVTHFEGTNPEFKAERSVVDMLSKRTELWKMQAELLRS